MRRVETYLETGSIAETARRWHTSRNVAWKWVQRRTRGKATMPTGADTLRETLPADGAGKEVTAV